MTIKEDEMTSTDVSLHYKNHNLPQAVNTSIGSGITLTNYKMTEDVGIQDDNSLEARSSSRVHDEQEPKDTKQRSVGPIELYRFGSRFDRVLMVVGTLFSLLSGCSSAVNLSYFGNIVTTFIIFSKQRVNVTSDNFTAYEGLQEAVYVDTTSMYINAVAVTVVGFIGNASWRWTAVRQIRRIRCLYFKSVLRQDMSWFDTKDNGALNATLSTDLDTISLGMDDKVSVILSHVSAGIACFSLAFFSSWKLSLVTLAFLPPIMGSYIVSSMVMRIFNAKEVRAYSKAGAIAEQAFSAIRTVTSFNGQTKESERYNRNLADSESNAHKSTVVFAVTHCIGQTTSFFLGGVCLYYGSQLVDTREISFGNIFHVMFGVFIGSMQFAIGLSYIDVITNARAAASQVYKIIDLIPNIDSGSKVGERPDHVYGNITFRDVNFSYPSRPNIQILKRLNFAVISEQTVAIVGASGCGKSTIIQLLQRFYDVTEGQITLDGRDIRELNIKFLRQHIGVVSQEPDLFSSSIAENIRNGKHDATEAEIIKASKLANAHDFITELPEGYDTIVGERGTLISGGQKQRIAIARALIRDPKILLLDEATSALDNENEAIVQRALEKARKGRTTIIVAHRLSTIRNADVIICIANSSVAEMGAHDVLLKRGGIYSRHVNHQITDIDHDGIDFSDVALVNGEVKNLSDPDRTVANTKPATTRLTSFEENAIAAEKTIKEHWSFIKILKLNKDEWSYMLVATVASAFVGATFPVATIFIGEFVRNFSETNSETFQGTATFLVYVMIGVGLWIGIVTFMQVFLFGVAGNRLTTRLRKMAFKAMLRKEIAFFDDESNRVGALTSRLSNDPASVQGATGQKIGYSVDAAMTVLGGLIIAFMFGWKLTFTILAFMPLMFLNGIFVGRVTRGFAQGDRADSEKSSHIATEAISNIRTVAQLTMEDKLLEKYSAIYQEHYGSNVKRAYILGALTGMSQGIMYYIYPTCFIAGALFVKNGEMEFYNVIRIFLVLNVGGMKAGRTAVASPEYSKAKLAAARLLELFHEEPKIDSASTSGESLSTCNGNIHLRNVTFQYPSRPKVDVFQNLNLSVNSGETVALVGASGGGKSTVTQLVERFYDVPEGGIFLDGKNIKKLNVQYLRSQVGIVSQEPTLFDCTIRENIEYGDNSRDVALPEIIAAARDANIHSFISTLPLGYETRVGDHGTQLSGGQKQRIAIARALLGNPKLLLLDEATSALDSESEKVVQEALDRARVGRACIVIAHRLSTIQNADKIAVIQDRRVSEQGTHMELMALKGQYYKLQLAQSRVIES